MKIPWDGIIFLLFLMTFFGLGFYLFASKNYIENSTRLQRRLGREILARYQETRFYFYFIKTIGLVFMFGSGWLIYKALKVIFHAGG